MVHGKGDGVTEAQSLGRTVLRRPLQEYDRSARAATASREVLRSPHMLAGLSFTIRPIATRSLLVLVAMTRASGGTKRLHDRQLSITLLTYFS